jgi:hypothetical protein
VSSAASCPLSATFAAEHDGQLSVAGSAILFYNWAPIGSTVVLLP